MVALSSIDPAIAVDPSSVSAPCRDSVRRNAQNTAFALRPSLEIRMSKQTSSVLRNLKRVHVQKNKTETLATQAPVEEIAIASYEGRTAQGSQEWNDILVLGT